MISNQLIKIIYALGLVIITIYGIYLLLPKENDKFNYTQLLYGLGVLILGNIVWRLVCEGIILGFSLHENVVEINNKISKRNDIENSDNIKTHYKPKQNIENPSATWDCPKCKATNSNSSFKCNQCGYSLA